MVRKRMARATFSSRTPKSPQALVMEMRVSVKKSLSVGTAAGVNRRKLVQRCAASSSRHRRRQLLLSDSQVCVGALGKGRSSSRKINRELRLMLPFFFSLGVSGAWAKQLCRHRPWAGVNALEHLFWVCCR